MRHRIGAFFLIFVLTLVAYAASVDRYGVVSRHNVVTSEFMDKSPAQVGNGHFSFGVDPTGLQSFIPFNTLADWSWHSSPLPDGASPDQFEPTMLDSHGRQVPHCYPDEKHSELSQWLAGNPHRFNLGRVGMDLRTPDGSLANREDLSNLRQETDLWSGIIDSRFMLGADGVHVRTVCHPDRDEIAVQIVSPLIVQGRLRLFIDFPYTEGWGGDYVGMYDCPEAHSSRLLALSPDSAIIERQMDDAHYYVSLQYGERTLIVPPGKKEGHRFQILPPKDNNTFELRVCFAKVRPPIVTDDVFELSRKAWEQYWQSGAAVDFSLSKDSRWKELERRVVLSQYLMRVNEAGILPPQESGLVNNGWYGRHHFEMVWWHGVHYGLWNRWELFDRYLGVYRNFLPTSKVRATEQGYKGARWAKCTANFDRDWPHPIHATLIWQQPHPIYFAEMDYRLHPTPATLEKWKDIVFETADFMADFAAYLEDRRQFVLGPPVCIVSENTDILKTTNPTFELSYWRYGLRVASEWCRRLGEEPPAQWKKVCENLAPLPMQDGLYVTHEGIVDMWTKFNFEHPALVGVYGMLPGDGVDKETFRRTLEKVCQTWNFNHTWGWDFPMVAMAAARTGQPELAVDMLLHSSPGFQFDVHGLCTGGPFPYFPANGGLLTAVAMMVGGWDGSVDVSETCPGFPNTDDWNIRFENFVPMQ